MGSTRAPVTRRFLITLAFVSAAAAGLSHEWAEEATTWLADVVPASDRGWALIGWTCGGPPLVLAALAWNDRARYDTRQRLGRARAYAAWFGLGGLVAPALPGNSVELFGDGFTIGNPAAFGWTCGAVANLLAITFALVITRMSRQGDARARALAPRLVEWAWILLVAGSMLFALYGRQMGFTY